MPKQFTLGKNERLKSRKQIEELFKEGKTFSVFPFRIIYIFQKKAPLEKSAPGSPEKSVLQFGVAAGTKNFKQAVDRNRIKRITKEAWRLQKNGLQYTLIDRNFSLTVFFVYIARELSAYDLVYDKVRLILGKLQTLINENADQ